MLNQNIFLPLHTLTAKGLCGLLRRVPTLPYQFQKWGRSFVPVVAFFASNCFSAFVCPSPVATIEKDKHGEAKNT